MCACVYLCAYLCVASVGQYNTREHEITGAVHTRAGGRLVVSSVNAGANHAQLLTSVAY